MQTISLCDRLALQPADGVVFSCSNGALNNRSNLVLQAAELVLETYRICKGCGIYLEKSVPVGGGLGGGSSDAAAALVGLARLWELSTPCEQLRKWAEHLGSDVPFFLYGGLALVEGRGEKVTPLAARMQDPRRYLLVSPQFEVSTRKVFEALSEKNWTDGSASRRVAESSETHAIGINGLQLTLFDLYPEARTCYDEVERVAPGRCIVSGTGPTVVALMESAEEAAKASESLAKLGFWTQTVTDYRMESWQTPCGAF